MKSGKTDHQAKQTTSKKAADQRENNQGLPNNLKGGIEHLSGLTMDNVKVHYNSAEPAALQADDYAKGSDIRLAPGQEHHLPHEVWHVAQQKEGRIQPAVQMKNVAVNDDRGLEQEADSMGAKAMNQITDASHGL